MSDSWRWVTWREVPGLRRSSSGWMSASDKRQARRAAVDHAADRRTVRFAEGGDGKKRAEGVARHDVARGKVEQKAAILPARPGAPAWMTLFPVAAQRQHLLVQRFRRRLRRRHAARRPPAPAANAGRAGTSVRTGCRRSRVEQAAPQAAQRHRDHRHRRALDDRGDAALEFARSRRSRSSLPSGKMHTSSPSCSAAAISTKPFHQPRIFLGRRNRDRLARCGTSSQRTAS